MVFFKRVIQLFPTGSIFLSNLQTSKKAYVYFFEVCKFEKNYFCLENVFFCEYHRLEYLDRSYANLKSWYFFKRDIQPLGISAKVPVLAMAQSMHPAGMPLKVFTELHVLKQTYDLVEKPHNVCARFI